LAREWEVREADKDGRTQKERVEGDKCDLPVMVEL